jgi:PAS domain S-box-containing protein
MYPLGIVGNILFCVLATVAMLRYDLLETKLMFRKGIAYSLVGVLVLGIFGGMTLLLNNVFQTALSPMSLTITILSVLIALIILTVFQPVLVRVQQVVDRWFYRERYDYLRALEQFSRETQSIANMQELGSNMVQLVAGALRASSACLLLPSNSSRELRVASSIGLEDPPRGIVFSDRTLFLKWLNTHGRTISSRELDIIPELHGLTQLEKQNLDMLQGDLYVPIRTHRGVLSGVLVLGEKLGQEQYSNEDKQLLATLAGQMAMVFENASLYRRSQQEVAERKQAEEHLRASEEKLRLTFESMAEGIVVTDLDADIVQMNEAVVRMHGYADKEELIGRSILSLVAKQNHTKVMESLETTLEKGYTRDIECECTFLGDNGNEFPVRLRTAVLKDASEGPTGFVVIIEDATERKKMEDQLRHSQLLASLGEMTAGIAHEVNNPLQSVLLYSDLLMAENIPAQSTRDLKVLRNEAKRAARIMTDLLTYSRRTASQERRIDLHRVIRRVLSMRLYAQTVQNITVTANLMDGPLPVKGDSSQLTQVFMNLIVNAEEALAESENKTIVVTSTVFGEWVKVSITDSGTGIPSENLNQVFYPFFTTKHEVKGTGLGLSTCYGIVTDHGGLVYATNNKMGGATFTVELPLVANESPKKLIEQAAGGS